MPPLHEALVEVHREYEKANRATRDMAEMYKKATTATYVLNAQYKWKQEENQRLKDQLRRDLVVLEKAKEQIMQLESQNRSLDSNLELQQKLEEVEKARWEAKIRADKAESRTRELEA